MSQPRESRRVPHLGGFRLDGWSVHQDEGTLCCAGHVVRLEPRVMDVLVYLAAEPGAVVSKEELLAAVWGGAFVEEGALAQAIHSLRKALGDDARQPRFIQTIPKRGYRLVASVVLEEMLVQPLAFPVPAPPAAAPVPEMPAGRKPARLSRWKAWLGLACALFGLVAALWLTRAHFRTATPQVGETPVPAVPAGRRIVVLPFEDYNKPEDDYFAKGLTEEITKDLASQAALQVISRTSALHYAGVHKPLPEIARELKVDYVLEGSVRWAPGPQGRPRVRITPQLIRAADDAHVWAGAFDREVADIFAVQSEISSQVIAQLGIALTPEQSRALRKAPTDNLEAYRAYLRGLELRNQPSYSPKLVLQAASMFERATELDPKFAAAWAELSQTDCYLAFNNDRSLSRVDAARKAMERAVALDPDLRSVGLARVYFAYRCQEDYDAAFAQLTEVSKRFPNDAEVLQTQGFVLRRKGRLLEAAEALQRAFALNPLDPKTYILVWATGDTYRALRNYEVADRFYQQAISLAPDQPFFWQERVLNKLSWSGDLAAARAILEKAPMPADPGLLTVTFKLDFYARDYRRALSRLTPERMRELQQPQERIQLSTLAAIARERMGDPPGALAAAEANRVELEGLVRSFPKEPFYPGFLAIALAQLGRGDEASALAEKTVRETRRDAFAGPNIVEFQAMAETLLGRRHEAIGRLSRLLASSYRWPISVHDLRLNPIWDPLHNDPEFKELLRRSSN
jgi:TolB-like protein/DNA-binding winged helix-turn-helix (wHTH) protein/Flp pilus assembly protein TadD